MKREMLHHNTVSFSGKREYYVNFFINCSLCYEFCYHFKAQQFWVFSQRRSHIILVVFGNLCKLLKIVKGMVQPSDINMKVFKINYIYFGKGKYAKMGGN